MTLSSDDLVRLESASRLLMSPLDAPDPAAWLLRAGAAVRDLVGGAAVVLQVDTGTVPFVSEDADDVVDGLLSMVDLVLTEGVRFTDPVTDLWNRLRREQNLATFSWDLNRRMVEAHGVSISQGYLIDQLRRQGYHDFVGMMGRSPRGESMIWVLQRTRDAFPFGERTAALLGALTPSFRAGLDTLARLGAHRAALDAVTEPLVAFGPDGRELYRNPALIHTLADDPEAAAIGRRLAQLGTDGTRQAPGPAGLPPAEATVRTARGTYTLRPTVLPPGLFGAEPALLVTVMAPAAPALPSPESVRERHGLTRREAEVALLLADGLSNADLADRLFVSPHTARHHVENVLAKLELSSRAAVAARLLRTVG